MRRRNWVAPSVYFKVLDLGFVMVKIWVVLEA
jgi:hypothetical protein